ncbi:hypothetical protein [Streptomyces sp. NPDC058382]|uniref:hypothetical protein n=1 Tax=unclassified Streptomyces TaxID=2593676 RepID=UPI00363B7B74
MVITPQDAATGAAKLWLSSPVAAGALSAAQPSASAEITRPGQQLQYTYDATVGDGAALLLSASNLSEATRLVHWAPGAVTEERLGYLTGTSFDATLRAPLTAGTHTVLLQPDEPATGHATATLLPDANGGPLTVSGGRKSVAITAAGQNAHYTFTGTKGQKVTLGLDTPPGPWAMSLWGPDGKWVYDATYMGATTVTKALSALPADGTYTLTINPDSMKTGTFNLGLTLPAAAPSKTTATQGPKPSDTLKTTSTKHTKPAAPTSTNTPCPHPPTTPTPPAITP